MPKRQTRSSEAAVMFRRLIEAVERGDLDAGGSQGRRLLRRMEGAATALDEASRRRGRPGRSTGTTGGRPGRSGHDPG